MAGLWSSTQYSTGLYKMLTSGDVSGMRFAACNIRQNKPYAGPFAAATQPEAPGGGFDLTQNTLMRKYNGTGWSGHALRPATRQKEAGVVIINSVGLSTDETFCTGRDIDLTDADPVIPFQEWNVSGAAELTAPDKINCGFVGRYGKLTRKGSRLSDALLNKGIAMGDDDAGDNEPIVYACKLSAAGVELINYSINAAGTSRTAQGTYNIRFTTSDYAPRSGESPVPLVMPERTSTDALATCAHIRTRTAGATLDYVIQTTDSANTAQDAIVHFLSVGGPATVGYSFSGGMTLDPADMAVLVCAGHGEASNRRISACVVDYAGGAFVLNSNYWTNNCTVDAGSSSAANGLFAIDFTHAYASRPWVGAALIYDTGNSSGVTIVDAATNSNGVQVYAWSNGAAVDPSAVDAMVAIIAVGEM